MSTISHAPHILLVDPHAVPAAQALVTTHYTVRAFGDDPTPLMRQRVLLWPAATLESVQHARQLTEALTIVCEEVKLIDPTGTPPGWGPADALREGWDFERLRAWAAPRVTVIHVHPEDPPNSSVSSFALWERLGLACTTSGQPIPNADNALRLLERHPPLTTLLFFDEFYHRSYKPDGNEWSDADTVLLLLRIQRDIGLSRLSKDALEDALTGYATTHRRHAVRDWLDTLAWDGIARIDSCLPLYFGAPDTEYVRAVSRNFWLGLAARAYHPGCQLDTMLVLEGRQGTRKTSALRAIGGAWHMEASRSVSDPEFFSDLEGKLVVEIADLDALARAEVTRIKQVLTCTSDRYRVKYGRRASDHPRQCVFVGTTNEDTYLRDHTGGRRFWPVPCGEIHDDLLLQARPLLFAEAAHRVRGGEAWHVVPQAEAEVEQEARRQHDPWESMISSWTSENLFLSEVTTNQVAIECLLMRGQDCNRMSEMRIGQALRKLGWMRTRRTRDGVLTYLYLRPGDNGAV